MADWWIGTDEEVKAALLHCRRHPERAPMQEGESRDIACANDLSLPESTVPRSDLLCVTCATDHGPRWVAGS